MNVVCLISLTRAMEHKNALAFWPTIWRIAVGFLSWAVVFSVHELAALWAHKQQPWCLSTRLSWIKHIVPYSPLSTSQPVVILWIVPLTQNLTTGHRKYMQMQRLLAWVLLLMVKCVWCVTLIQVSEPPFASPWTHLYLFGPSSLGSVNKIQLGYRCLQRPV